MTQMENTFLYLYTNKDFALGMMTMQKLEPQFSPVHLLSQDWLS